MGRKLSDEHRAVEPIRTFDAYPHDSRDGWGTIQEARLSTFGPGDVIAILIGDKPRRALVVAVHRERSERIGEWIQRYLVRHYRADGKLSGDGRFASPGHISRGFEALAAEKALAEEAEA